MSLIDQALTPDNLRIAWQQVAANAGSPGVDDVSIADWRRDWEANLAQLADDVRRNRYKPLPLRRFRVPKKRMPGFRTLTILTVRDRIIQRAILNVLEPIYERKFLDFSYGYRPDRSVGDAVERIVELRDKSFAWVLDADIDDCFPSLDHELLRAFIREDLDDWFVLRLIDLWLHQMGEGPEEKRGIALGAVISPLLCNIYLHHLDTALVAQSYIPIRYADDFIVMCHTERHARRAYLTTAFILEELLLRYEPQKTRISSFAAGFDFLGVHFEQDTYSYHWQQKKIEVKGKFVRPWYGPDGYE
ncbi:MAG: hypothetical protein Kow0077_22880 [Anaerolineae bacterium]